MKLIYLTQDEVSFVDDEDYDTVSQYSWHPWRSKKHDIIYAQTNTQRGGKRTTVCMHSLILPDAELIDHINHDGLDNRRKNLRAATAAQNNQNRRPDRGRYSHYKGVDYIKRKDRWRSRITVDGKCITLGLSFKTEQEAALAYNVAAQELFGEFAYLNVL